MTASRVCDGRLPGNSTAHTFDENDGASQALKDKI
jgi:hypothetical protein